MIKTEKNKKENVVELDDDSTSSSNFALADPLQPLVHPPTAFTRDNMLKYFKVNHVRTIRVLQNEGNHCLCVFVYNVLIYQ